MAVNVPFEMRILQDGDLYYISNAWTKDDIIPKNEALPRDIFFIRVCLREIPQSCNFLQEGGNNNPISEESLGPLRAKSFWITKTSLLNNDLSSKQDVLNALEFVGVPKFLGFSMLEEVVCFARRLVKEPINAACEVLPFVFGVAVMKFNPMKRKANSDIPEASSPKRQRFEDCFSKIDQME